MADYTDTEVIIVRASRELTSEDLVFVGVGVPNLACNFAEQTHAPGLEMMYESGTIGSDSQTLPLSIGDPGLATGAHSIVSMMTGFRQYLQAGLVDVGFLGGAQIDRYGNINSTVIGDYDDPKAQLPGSGGTCDIAINAKRTLVIAPHEARRFPERVDFVSSPGHVDERTRKRFSMRGGPARIITDKAVMAFDDAGEMYVESVHPGSSREAVADAIGWEVAFADPFGRTDPPTEDDVHLLREEIDPEGMYTG